MVQHPFRNTFLTRHHLKSSKRGGIKEKKNLVCIWWDKHCAWHNLYDHFTLGEIIGLMELELRGMNTVLSKRHDNASWTILWRRKDMGQAMSLLKRFRKIKNSAK